MVASSRIDRTHSQVAASTSTFGDSIADLIRKVLLASHAGYRLLDVEFDRRHVASCCGFAAQESARQKKTDKPDGWAGLTKHKRYKPLGDATGSGLLRGLS